MFQQGHRATRCAGLWLAVLGTLFCSEADEPVTVTARASVQESFDNLLLNPGFELEREGWSWLESSTVWGDFSIVGQPVRSGKRAARLRLDQSADLPPRRVMIRGMVQEVAPERFPKRMGGWYRVDVWEKAPAETALYLQAAVIAFGDPRTPALVSPAKPMRGLNNFQMRYYLAGAAEPAFLIKNGKVRIISKAAPRLGEWVYFELPLEADFERLWGTVPQDYDMLRILFEARWDNMPHDGSARADVYYDDLFLDYGKPAEPARSEAQPSEGGPPQGKPAEP